MCHLVTTPAIPDVSRRPGDPSVNVVPLLVLEYLADALSSGVVCFWVLNAT